MNTIREDYIKRIDQVLDFIEKNLDSELSLEKLADKAHYSPYHFHRIFSTIVRERPNLFINRKRIERIAGLLAVGTDTPLTELAGKYGFKSDSSFSRAFKKYYGVSPTKFKTEGIEILSKIGIAPLSISQYICDIDNQKKWLNMNAQIEVTTLPEIKLAGITHIGKFEKIAETFQRVIGWASKQGLMNDPNFKALTVYHDNPKITESSKVRLSACVVINTPISKTNEVRTFGIPKGNFVIGRFEITVDLFQKAWDSMCFWVIEEGYTFRDGDYFEIYHNDHETHPEKKFIVDICIPIEQSPNTSSLNRTRTNYTFGQTNDNLTNYHTAINKGEGPKDYERSINYIKELRRHYIQQYAPIYSFGTIYQGSMDYTYFSLTPSSIKPQKLKFVIIFDHQRMCFKICLSGQNKTVRKKYWSFFKNSDWNKYPVVESIDNSLSIIEHTLLEKPNFENLTALTDQIDQAASVFIDELLAALE